MKKFFLFCMMALVAMCGLNSCSDDCNHDYIEVDYSKKLAGTWTCVDAENEFAEALIFNADGTVTSTGVFEGAFYEKKGTYQIKGNKMTLSFEDGDGMESRFEMVEGEVFSLVDDELDVHFNYNYCENDLSDEIVGMWVCTQKAFGEEEESTTIVTYKENGKAYFTGFFPETNDYVNQIESDYKVVGNIIFSSVEDGTRYLINRINIIPNGTELGDIMTTYDLTSGTNPSFLRVKQHLNLTGQIYDYNTAYVTNAKGADEDFTIMGNTFNIAKIKAGDFDKMFRADLFSVELDANSFKYKLRLDNGQDTGFDAPMTVDGNKVTLDMSAINPVLKKVDMYMFQDANDTQVHVYMHTDAFINYFANMEVYTLILEGKINPSDSAAIAKVFADMEARIESINVTFVMKVRK